MKDLKYLIAYIAPLAAAMGLWLGGFHSISAVLIVFVALPLLEILLPQRTQNHDEADEPTRSGIRFFDWLLYSHVPILYGLMGWAFVVIGDGRFSTLENVGLLFSMGIMVGAFGINVAHELGHRNSKIEQLMSKMLLLPALYLHFYIEHNRGHHKHVATDADPASARLNENLYHFWVRSVVGSWISAWQLSADDLRRNDKNATIWTLKNEMLQFQLLQIVYLGVIFWAFGFTVLLFAIGAAAIGFLLLETVNYIEHYGLRRKMLASGRYEPVLPRHSWNSNHDLGRIFLYELTRHSDHHYKSTRKYQILRHHEESPQLPMGYPAAILLALFPPLWFRRINPIIPPQH
ncbi:MAG: hypothetical protein RL757_2001 [Bacteroidota bacterium]|jgi:alkane 1-monooxygenase